MAATQTVPQHFQHCKFAPILPRHGVITLFGYGIKVTVDRGHLAIQDGIGLDRREARLPRVGHGLRRLVIIGSDGMVSLAALRWLADQNASFCMLSRDGSVLATTGPVSPSDVRLRRAQSLAHHSDVALRIARELIDQKLRGQERVIQKYFPQSFAGESIVSARNKLLSAKSSDQIRAIEARGALADSDPMKVRDAASASNSLNKIDPEELVRLALSQSTRDLYDMLDQNRFSILADASAVALTKVLSNKKLTANDIDNILAIIYMSFAVPKAIETLPDRCPRTTLLLLRYLDVVTTDAVVKRRIANTKRAVEALN